MRKAADATALESARIAFTVSSAEIQGPTVSGTFDFARRRGALSYPVADLGEGTIVSEYLYIDGLVYMDYTKISETIASDLGFRWVMRRAGERSEGTVAGATEASPSAPIEALRGAQEMRRTGRAPIDGVETTRYEGVTDLDTALDRAPTGARNDLAARFEQLFPVDDVIPVEVWIDDEGFIRKVAMRYLFSPIDGGAEGEVAEASLELVLSDIGVRIDVRTPPDDEVLTEAELGNKLVGGDGRTIRDDARRMRDSLPATRDAKTARISLRQIVSAPDGQSSSVDVAGVFDVAREDRASFTYLSPDEGFIAPSEVRVVDDFIYIDVAALMQEDAAISGVPLTEEEQQRHWLATVRNDLDTGDAASIGARPISFLEVVRGIYAAELIGPDTVEGVPTTHFRARVGIDSAVRDAPRRLRRYLKQEFGRIFAGDDDLPIDLWIDEEGRARRLILEVELDLGAGEVLSAFDLVIPTFGDPVEVVAPPRDALIESSDVPPDLRDVV